MHSITEVREKSVGACSLCSKRQSLSSAKQLDLCILGCEWITGFEKWELNEIGGNLNTNTFKWHLYYVQINVLILLFWANNCQIIWMRLGFECSRIDPWASTGDTGRIWPSGLKVFYASSFGVFSQNINVFLTVIELDSCLSFIN
jgi:hypothetical protein